MAEASTKLQFLAVLLVLVVAVLFAAFNLSASFVLGKLFSGSGSNPVKDSPYECGMEPTTPARMRFSVKFYIVAVLFILFDIEVVFMYPWAMKFHQLGWFGFAEMLAFLSVLLSGWVYVVRKGALDWER